LQLATRGWQLAASMILIAATNIMGFLNFGNVSENKNVFGNVAENKSGV